MKNRARAARLWQNSRTLRKHASCSQSAAASRARKAVAVTHIVGGVGANLAARQTVSCSAAPSAQKAKVANGGAQPAVSRCGAHLAHKKNSLFRSAQSVLSLFISILFLSGTSLLLGGCSFGVPSVEQAARAHANTITPAIAPPALKTAGTLTVGINELESSPLLFLGNNYEARGLDIDLASALAEQLGLKVKFVKLENSRLNSAVDIVMGVHKSSPSSAGTANSSKPGAGDASSSAQNPQAEAQEAQDANTVVIGGYAERATAVFAKMNPQTAGLVPAKLTASDLSGKRLALQKDSISQNDLSHTQLKPSIVPVANLIDAFKELSQGKVDYVLCQAYPGAYLAARNQASFMGLISVPQSIGIGVSAKNVSLQNAIQGALDKISSNGTYDFIRARWLGNLKPLSQKDMLGGLNTK